MLQVDPIQNYLNLQIGLPPVLKAGSSGIDLKTYFSYLKSDCYLYTRIACKEPFLGLKIKLASNKMKQFIY